MSRTVCSWCKNPFVENKDGVLVCKNIDCPACAEEFLHAEIARLKKENDLLKTQLATGGTGAICNSYTVVRFDEYQATRKALDVAVDALDTVRQYYRGTAVIRPHNIAAYCDNKIDQINEIKGGKDD